MTKKNKDLLVCPQCGDKLYLRQDAVADINPDTGEIVDTVLYDDTWIECFTCLCTSKDYVGSGTGDEDLVRKLNDIWSKL